MIKARVTVTLKNGVLDPQGKAIEHALGGLETSDRSRAEAELRDMAAKLLANTVIEDFTVEVL